MKPWEMNGKGRQDVLLWVVVSWFCRLAIFVVVLFLGWEEGKWLRKMIDSGARGGGIDCAGGVCEVLFNGQGTGDGRTDLGKWKTTRKERVRRQ